MKIEAEITNVRTSKKGDTITIFVSKEHRKHVVEGIMPFIERPVTLELLIDTKKVIENMDRISDEQRKKIYALFKDFGNEYGDTPENVKELLKQEFYNATGITFSLSDCTAENASKFIEWVIQYSQSKNYGFAFKETQSPFAGLLAQKKCFVCQQAGKTYGNSDGKVCLCDKHAEECNRISSKEFIKLYHLELV